MATPTGSLDNSEIAAAILAELKIIRRSLLAQEAMVLSDLAESDRFKAEEWPVLEDRFEAIKRDLLID